MLATKWVLVILTTAALLGAVVAWAASISVGGTDKLGSGAASVVAPTSGTSEEVKVTDVEWTLDTNDSTKVFAVEVTFEPITLTTFDAVHLVLKGNSGVLQQKTFNNQQIDGIIIDLNKISWGLSPLVTAADITKFAITIVDAVP